MIVLDSSIIVSFYNTRDQNHVKAVRLMDRIKNREFGTVYVTNFIFGESVTVIMFRIKSLEYAVKAGEVLENSAELADIEKPDFKRGWEIFKNQQRTKLSFTDCTTLAFMKNREIANIATFDKDFEKIEGVKVVN